MKQVTLFCANGYSTAMLSKKLADACMKAGCAGQYSFSAYPYTEFAKQSPSADIILIAPQIRYNLKHVQARYPDRPVILLDTVAYGMQDGVKIFKQVRDADK